MRERDINRKLFHKGHYEIIAKRFREALEPYFSTDLNDEPDNGAAMMTARSVLVTLAIDFARRFQADNEDFDPTIFLNRCSPNPELYPLSELWQEDASEEGYWEHDG